MVGDADDEAYADRFRGRISERSTVARSVMGRHVGEEVRVPIGPAVEPAAEEAGAEEAGVHFRVLAVSG